MNMMSPQTLIPRAGKLATELCIVSDVEHASHLPGNPVAILPAPLPLAGRVAVLESLFPEVRTLAYLSAGGASPQRADWLAARVMVFSLHHLGLGMSELALMDLVQQKLQQLAQRLAIPREPLQSFAVHNTAPQGLTCGAGQARNIAGANIVQQSLQLRRQMQCELQRLREAWARII